MTGLPITIGFPQIRKLIAGELTTLIRPRSQRFGTLKLADRLWVREPFCFDRKFDHLTPTAAESLGARPFFLADLIAGGSFPTGGKPRIAYNLPRAVHRQHLKVATIGSIRLHDLGDDAIAAQGFDNPEDWAHVWNRSLSVCGPGRNRFDDNPLVLQIAFQRIAAPLPERGR